MTLQEWVQESTLIDGLVSIHKPFGIPSTAITEMYKIATKLKVGHGGTLDPLAEGAMLLGLGKGTKLLTNYLQSEKKYRTKILIGALSASGDLELPIEIASNEIIYVDTRVTEILTELSSGFTQEIPQLSAIKIKGKTSFQLTRQGKEVERRYIETKLLDWAIVSEKHISSLELQVILQDILEKMKQGFEKFYSIADTMGYRSRKYSFMLEKWSNSIATSIRILQEDPEKKFIVLDIEVKVPKGTYIRALASDIAKRLGSTGVLLKLERLDAGKTL